MTKRECFERIAGCFFFDVAIESEDLQNRRSQFDKVMGSRLPEEYINFLWDWGLYLEKEVGKGRSVYQDIKLAEAIKYFSHAQSASFGSVDIDDEEVLRAVLKTLKGMFVQRHTWDGWTIGKISDENIDMFLFECYYDRSLYGYRPNERRGRPAKNKKLQIIGWRLYFIVSFEEKQEAVSLTKDKLAIITDFIDFFQLYDYPDCNEKKEYERNAIKASMNHFRKQDEWHMLCDYCKDIINDYQNGLKTNG